VRLYDFIIEVVLFHFMHGDDDDSAPHCTYNVLIST
jgi:hypothetical protein